MTKPHQEEMSPGSYPAKIDVRPPPRFDRIQVLLRLFVLAALGVLHQTVGGLFGALYVLLPVTVAILISRKGVPRFRWEDTRWVIAVLDWVVGFYAYLSFVTDRFPLHPRDRAVRLHVRAHGTPTTGAALARLVTSLPHGVVLMVLGIASGFVGFAIAIAVLVKERCPAVLYGFQRDVVAWVARFFAYHTSLVEPYPPFGLETREERHSRGDHGHAPLV